MLDFLLGKLLLWKYKAAHSDIWIGAHSSVREYILGCLTSAHPKSPSVSIEHVPKNRMVNVNINLLKENSMTNDFLRGKKIAVYNANF